MSVVIKRQSAFDDLDEIAAHLGQQSEALALRFLNAVESTFQSLATMPGVGSPWESDQEELAGLRFSSVSGFRNHIIFYLTLTDPVDGIEVVRVLHAAQDIAGILGGSPG